jgi:EAL domain-containing protein (putative c-di-GMP-specific phosphodiesterase class I)/CheY-like chemotaxis protein
VGLEPIGTSGASPHIPAPDGAVLVVGPGEHIRNRYARALRNAGLPTLQATDSEEAIDLVGRHHVGAVLLDAEVPGMNSFEALRILRGRAQTRTLPIVLVTGRAEVTERVAGLQAGASDYLVAPVNLEELVARVQAQLRGQAAWLQVVESHRRDRALVSEALSRLRVEPTPELTASRICRELVGLDGLTSAAIVAFTREGGALLLALGGRIPSTLGMGWPLTCRTARMLWTRAEQGPWIVEPPRSGGSPAPRGGATSHSSLVDLHTTFAAYAPLRSRDTVIGLLTIVGRAEASDRNAARAKQLAVAIDFAAMASALLGPALEERSVTKRARAELEWVLGGGAFCPVFQPIHGVLTGQIVGYEALTRFADGAPAEPRFAAAARVGMGLEIEAVTLDAALHAATSLPGNAWLSINVSPRFVLEGNHIVQAVKSSQRLLVLELTEHDPIDDYPAFRAAVDRLGGAAQLSIDDAGTGYACLSHVLALRPEFLKLARSWVHGIDSDPTRQALVAGLEHFSSRTGCCLIAEGVETDAELAVLQHLGVPLAQGYLLGHPVPILS